MTIEEQAKKYGVPMPETCKLIEPYLEETTLMWCQIGDNGHRQELGYDNYERGDYVVCLSSSLQYGNVDYFTPELIPAFEMSDTEEDIRAPQIHELMQVISVIETAKSGFLTICVGHQNSFSQYYHKMLQEGRNNSTPTNFENIAEILAQYLLKVLIA